MYIDMEKTPSNRILLVIGDPVLRRETQEKLEECGHEIEWAGDGFKAIEKFSRFRPDLVLSHYHTQGIWGGRLLKKLKHMDPYLAVIFMDKNCSWTDAVQVVKEGASDFLRTPVETEALIDSIQKALKRRESSLSQESTRHVFNQGTEGFSALVGTSLPMQTLYRAIKQIAPSQASVLICGESGTGKELVARAIHDNSPRKNGPFVSLNCAALAEGILESELFGHEKGAFSGALQRREGHFRLADKGTLLLDEVVEIPLGTQVKLLRFLQERDFQRVGSNETIKVDTRILAATNKDLSGAVKRGVFREDLFYRLNVISLHVPALREKPKDIPLLCIHFLKRFCKENNKNIKDFADDAIATLMAWHWPGNVRELENAIQRAVVLATGPRIHEEHLPPYLYQKNTLENPSIPGSKLEDIERYAIEKTLEMVGGSTAKAADILGISKRKIQYKMKQYRSNL